jgi:iron complex outermembrane receptor protein
MLRVSIVTRSRAVAGLCLMVPLLLINQGHAQSAPPTPQPGSEEILKLEAFTVTGTNIVRIDAEKVLPVTVLSKDVMDTRNAVTPVEMITALPQVTSVPVNESAQGGAGARGDNAAVNLRGIGQQNSLVLLNGRRLAMNPVSGGTSANINQLPTQGIAHVDVLRDGASSIYGSDAVAGVINYVMSNDYRGTDLRLRYAMPDHPGGSNVEGTLTYGQDLANGRGHILSTFDTAYRDAIYLDQRSFSAKADHTSQAPAPFNVPGSKFDGNAAVGFYPTYNVSPSTAITYFRPVSGVMTFTNTAPNRTANPEFYINTNDRSMGMPRLKRLNWFTNVEYNLNDRVTAFADASYYYANTENSRIGWGPTEITAPGSDTPAPVSVDNPYNPYGSRFYNAAGAPNADGTPRIMGTPKPLTLLSVLIDLPDRAGREKVTVLSRTYRTVAGLRGKLGDSWKWEAGALWSAAQVMDRSFPAVRESLFDQALMRTDATAYNPFGYTFKVQGTAVVPDQPYKNPASVQSTYYDEWRRNGVSRIRSLDLSASGRLWTIWSGDISLALGSEYRKEDFSDTRRDYAGLNLPGYTGPSPVLSDPNNNDYLVVSPKKDNSGQRTVTSAYLETVVPLAGPKNDYTLVRSLELSASGRTEKYSDFGKTTNPKVGVNWKPFTNVMIRASQNRGFTAPPLPTLYAPSQFSVDGPPGTVDPYRNPVTNEGPYLQKTYSQGNPNLKPTTSRGKSAGIVFEVPHVKGLSFTADYWEIDQKDVIGSLSTTQILNSDAALLIAYTNQQVAAGVPVGQIDAGSGTANYKGDPAVVRLAPTAAEIATFAAYNAAHPSAPMAAVGLLISRSAPSLNLAQAFASGWDVGTAYNLPALSIGKFSLTSDWAYLRKSFTINLPPNAKALYSERITTGGNSRWRGSSAITWRRGNWSAGFSGYYIGSYSDSSATTTQAVYESLGRPTYLSKTFDTSAVGNYLYRYIVHDSVTFNAYVGYRFGAETNRWLRKTSVRLGVVNLRDSAPPLASGAFGYDSSVYGGMLVGRNWTLELTKSF